MKIAICLVALLTSGSAHAARAAGTSSSSVSIPSNDEIHRILVERVNALAGDKDGIGIVVGIVSPADRRIISCSQIDRDSSRAVDGDTVFEIASVTKVFTALLLADMAERGEVALNDPVAKYLPENVKLPEQNGRSITLLDLATHTSGLPFMPEQMDESVRPTVSDLYRFLANYKIKQPAGSQWDYSNLGYWLLGEALAARGKTSYENLLQTRVIAPLNLKNTAFVLTPEMRSRFAIGHNVSLEPTPYVPKNSFYEIMPAAGLLYSSANDLLSVMSAAMDFTPSPLTPAMKIMLQTRRPIASADSEQSLGWTIIGRGDEQLVFHDGGSYGSASVAVWNPAKRVGVVVLSNHINSVADIGRHILQPNFPLKKPDTTKHTETFVDPITLQKYVGRYEATGEGIFEIQLEDGSLTFEAPSNWGLPKLHLHPESRTKFFATELPLLVNVEPDADGRATELRIQPPRGQNIVIARRVEPNK